MKIYLILLIVMVCISLTSAVQPTQQSNKIFLNPFYTSAMTNNVNSTFNIAINPPDKISSVISAIVAFDIYITPTVTFNLWVNGISCNTPSYTVSTTFASAGQSRISFDCSNIITKAGNYTATLKPVGANTGSVNGWVDLTYMNNPQGSIGVSGTEYSPGDPATIFTQLKDSQGIPVSNGSCFLDIYYPLNSSGQHPNTLQDAPMLQALGNDGLYYYDLTAPSTLGVYMLSARCAYAYNFVWIYKPTELILKPIISTAKIGTWFGDSLALNNFDGNMFECDVAGGGSGCFANFTFNMSAYGSFTNITNINLYYAGQIHGSTSNDWTLILSYYNGTGFVKLPNTLLLQHQAGAPSAPDQFVSNTINTSAIINGTIILQYNITGGTGTGTQVYNDWLSISLLSSTGTIQDVKGSSEMHITNKANVSVTATVNSTQISDTVWSASNRSLTYYQNQTQVDMTNYSKIGDSVWGYNGTISTNLLIQISNAINNLFNVTFLTNIANSIWSSSNRTLTFYPNQTQTDMINYTKINEGVANSVWTFNNRSLTYYPDNTNYSQIIIGVWNATNRNLTFYPTQIDLTNYSKIADSVWTASTRNLTQYIDTTNYTQITIGIWSATNRSLTFYPAQIDLTNYTQVANSVWTAVNRSLTESPTANVNTTAISESVWNYSARYTHGEVLQ